MNQKKTERSIIARLTLTDLSTFLPLFASSSTGASTMCGSLFSFTVSTITITETSMKATRIRKTGMNDVPSTYFVLPSACFSVLRSTIMRTVAKMPPMYPTRFIIAFALLLSGFSVTSGMYATAGER